MAQRNSTTSKAPTTTATSTTETANARADAIEQQVVAFAEQLGRVVCSVQARAEGWLDPRNLNEQISRVRDGATSLLQQLAATTEAKTERVSTPRSTNRTPVTRTSGSAVSTPAGRSGGVVDAPGKKHRKPTPNEPLRASAADQGRIARMKTANANRKRGRG